MNFGKRNGLLLNQVKHRSINDSKPHISFIIHDVEGGVASMNHQIITHAPFEEYFDVHIILWRSDKETNKPFSEDFPAAKTIVKFQYSVYDKWPRTLKNFSQLLNTHGGIIVTNDGFELEALRKYGTASALFSIVHDFYNLKLAVESISLVDQFICHTEIYFRALSSSRLLANRVAFLLHGVELPRELRPANGDGKLRIVSISRLIETKGVLLFAALDDQLRNRGIEVQWIIIGSGELETQLKKQWESKNNVIFHNPDSRSAVYEIARKGDLFISPSTFEGYGIALLEAMACGLVPVIYKLPIGIYADLPQQVGFSVLPGNETGLIDAITHLHNDRSLLEAMSTSASEFVRSKYDINKTAIKYLEFIRHHIRPVIDRRMPQKDFSKTGLLDRSIIPNTITRALKKWRSR